MRARARSRTRPLCQPVLIAPHVWGARRAPFASRKIGDETTNAFPLLKPPTGKRGSERKEFNLAGFPPKVEKDEDGNEQEPTKCKASVSYAPLPPLLPRRR